MLSDIFSFRSSPGSSPGVHTLSPLQDDSGWSLTELLIAIVIIGVLALMAIPRLTQATSRAKMVEAKTMLKTLHAFQQSHFYEFDRYGETLEMVGFEQSPLVVDGGTARYLIAVEEAGPSAYLATATSVVDFDGDGTLNVWEVDQAGVIRQRTPD